MHNASLKQSAAPEAGGAVDWPLRACCCPAPPVARVLMPTRDNGTVDLYLCGHHYRASLGPLALAGAAVSFRERVPVPELAHPR